MEKRQSDEKFLKERKERKRINILKLETALNGLEASRTCVFIKATENRLQNVCLEFFNNSVRLECDSFSINFEALLVLTRHIFFISSTRQLTNV